jgi:hypothetical protein
MVCTINLLFSNIKPQRPIKTWIGWLWKSSDHFSVKIHPEKHIEPVVCIPKTLCLELQMLFHICVKWLWLANMVSLSSIYLSYISVALQVPHSQCSLGENSKFLQNFRPKKNTLKGNVWVLFSYNIYHSILGLTFKVL